MNEQSVAIDTSNRAALKLSCAHPRAPGSRHCEATADACEAIAGGCEALSTVCEAIYMESASLATVAVIQSRFFTSA